MLIADLSADHRFFRLPSVTGIITVLANGSQAGEVQTTSKGSVGRCTWCTSLPYPLRTTTFKARYPPALLPLPGPLTNFISVGGWAQTTPQGCGWVRCPNRKVQAGICHPSRLITADLRSCQSLSWLLLSHNHFLHSLYVREAGLENCDIDVCRDLCQLVANKGNSPLSQICLLISKSPE